MWKIPLPYSPIPVEGHNATNEIGLAEYPQNRSQNPARQGRFPKKLANLRISTKQRTYTQAGNLLL
jgi:hypothetical protein